MSIQEFKIRPTIYDQAFWFGIRVPKHKYVYVDWKRIPIKFKAPRKWKKKIKIELQQALEAYTND